MNKFSKQSKKEIETLHPFLQLIANEAIRVYDFKVLQGYRSPSEQLKLYKQGRETPGNIVTNIDGYNVKSNHNYMPSRAMDLAPYPIDWKDIERFYHLAGIIKGIAKVYNIDIDWGGDWNSFKDYPHFEIL